MMDVTQPPPTQPPVPSARFPGPDESRVPNRFPTAFPPQTTAYDSNGAPLAGAYNTNPPQHPDRAGAL